MSKIKYSPDFPYSVHLGAPFSYHYMCIRLLNLHLIEWDSAKRPKLKGRLLKQLTEKLLFIIFIMQSDVTLVNGIYCNFRLRSILYS